jgi:hypothetical protein
MYTQKKLHKIKKCYINLRDSDIEYNELVDAIDLFNDDTIIIFDQYILYKDYVKDIFNFLNYKHSNYILRYRSDDFKLLSNIEYTTLYNLNVCLDGSFGYNVLNRINLKDYNYYIDLKTFDDLNFNIFNLKCDIFIRDKDICHIHTTVKLLSDIGLYSNLYFVNHKKSTHYGNHCEELRHKVNKNIFNELTISNILTDTNLKIDNKEYVMNNYSCMDTDCKLYKNVTILYLDKDLNICLCPNLDVSTKVKVFDGIQNGCLMDDVVEQIRILHNDYCMCCNHTQL